MVHDLELGTELRLIEAHYKQCIAYLQQLRRESLSKISIQTVGVLQPGVYSRLFTVLSAVGIR